MHSKCTSFALSKAPKLQRALLEATMSVTLPGNQWPRCNNCHPQNQAIFDPWWRRSQSSMQFPGLLGPVARHPSRWQWSLGRASKRRGVVSHRKLPEICSLDLSSVENLAIYFQYCYKTSQQKNLGFHNAMCDPSRAEQSMALIYPDART